MFGEEENAMQEDQADQEQKYNLLNEQQNQIEQKEISTLTTQLQNQNLTEPQSQSYQPQTQLYVEPNPQHNLYKNIDKIWIGCEEPIIKEGISRYVVYTVKGYDKDGSYEVMRRYSEFVTFRETLIKQWPGVWIPSIPRKQKIGNMEPMFIEQRRVSLDKFLKNIAKNENLYYSEEMQLFAKSMTNDIEKQLNALPRLTNQELIAKYQVAFKFLSGKEINTELIQKINQFSTYLQKTDKMLINLQEMAKNASISRLAYNDRLNTFLNYCLPDYEKNCLLEYVNNDADQLIMAAPDALLQSYLLKIRALKNNQNAFDDLENFIKEEIEDIQAFRDCINQKNLYEIQRDGLQTKLKNTQLELQKLLAGNKSFKMIFSSQSKEQNIQKLEASIINLQSEIQTVQFICDIITVILGYLEIQKFKEQKTSWYFNLMRRMAILEVDYYNNIKDIWNHVLKQPAVSRIQQN